MAQVVSVFFAFQVLKVPIPAASGMQRGWGAWGATAPGIQPWGIQLSNCVNRNVWRKLLKKVIRNVGRISEMLF